MTSSRVNEIFLLISRWISEDPRRQRKKTTLEVARQIAALDEWQPIETVPISDLVEITGVVIDGEKWIISFQESIRGADGAPASRIVIMNSEKSRVFTQEYDPSDHEVYMGFIERDRVGFVATFLAHKVG